MIDEFKPNKYLVYQAGTCEMGSEGFSSYYYFCVAQGNTEEEIIMNWAENVEKLYGVKINPKKWHNGKWYDYYPILMEKLPESMYGRAGHIEIVNHYEKHND